MNGHITTDIYKAATPPPEWGLVVETWVIAYKTDKEGLVVKTKARLVVEGLSPVRNVENCQTSALPPSSASVEIMVAAAHKCGFWP